MQFLLYNLSYDLHLPLPTVGDNQVGQGSVLVYSALITPSHHLFHRSIIVRSHHRLDKILPVVLFRGFGFLEHHAGSYRIRTLNV